MLAALSRPSFYIRLVSHVNLTEAHCVALLWPFFLFFSFFFYSSCSEKKTSALPRGNFKRPFHFGKVRSEFLSRLCWAPVSVLFIRLPVCCWQFCCQALYLFHSLLMIDALMLLLMYVKHLKWYEWWLYALLWLNLMAWLVLEHHVCRI